MTDGRKPDQSLVATLYKIVAQCAFYAPCRVLIRSMPSLLHPIELVAPAGTNATSEGSARIEFTRDVCFDLLIALSYSEDGQFFIAASLPNAFSLLFDFAQRPIEHKIAHAAAMLVLRNLSFNKALRGRLVALRGLTTFLMQFLFDPKISPQRGFDRSVHILAISMLVWFGTETNYRIKTSYRTCF